jgi:ribosomal protein L11 methyltransferase
VWEEEDTLLLFFHKNKDSLIKRLDFKLHFYTCIHYKDWESGKFIKPFKIGNFYIIPVWEKDNFKNKKHILIDPSVVFGTGFHPTTRMILETFDTLSESRFINSTIDLGCGSGILGIFAGKKGAKDIVAIDNNNLSFKVSKKNFFLNNINAKVCYDDIFSYLPYNYDAVFANLYYHLLFDLFKEKEFWQSKYYFLSGFIKTMESFTM